MSLTNTNKSSRITYQQCLFFMLFLIPSFIFSQSWSFGGGAIYGDDIDTFGIHLRSYYNLPDEKICFGPEYSYFFEQTDIVEGEEISRQLS